VHESSQTMPNLFPGHSFLLRFTRAAGQLRDQELTPSIGTYRYAHINATCLRASPLARWYREFEAAGGDYSEMVVHLEPAADYDGLAVYWGKQNSCLILLP
jgi:hypothetical protein